MKGVTACSSSCLGPWAWCWALGGAWSRSRLPPTSTVPGWACAICPAPPGRGPLASGGPGSGGCCPWCAQRWFVHVSVREGCEPAAVTNRPASATALPTRVSPEPPSCPGQRWPPSALQCPASASVAPSSPSSVSSSVNPGCEEPGSPHWQGTRPHGPTCKGGWEMGSRQRAPVRRSRGGA